MRKLVHAITKLAHFWSDIRWFPPYASATLRFMRLKGLGKKWQLLHRVIPESGGIPARGCGMSSLMFTVLKTVPTQTKPGILILEIEHDKGKCTSFYCCFGHYRMLAYKISACEVCMTWRKPTEACKISLPIAELRTGKPAMVHFDCSTIYDKTLRANIYVRSHLGCGTDSVFICFLQVSQIFQRRKNNVNKQDFENKLNLTCQAQ